MQKEKRFAVGDFVQWKSQAAGSLTSKSGTVVEVVQPKRTPSTFPNVGLRDHESYIVEVTSPQKPGRKPKKPTRYWPLVVHLSGARRQVAIRDIGKR